MTAPATTTQPYADGRGPTRAAERPTSPANSATPPAYPEDTSSTAIRSDISRTRSEMDSTLDQLGERLSPSHLIDDAADFAKSWFGFGGSSATAATAEPVYEERVLDDGTVVKIRREGAVASGPSDIFGLGDLSKSGTRLASTVADAIRDNPVPTAICAAGLAYAFFEDPIKKYARLQYREHFGPTAEPRMHSGSYVDARTGRPYDSHYGEGYRNPNSTSWTDAVGNALGNAGDAISGAASTAAGYVTGAASSAGHAVTDAASSAGHAVQRFAANTAREVRVEAGKVYDAATGALLHAGSKAKDGVVAAADTTADAAGNVRDRATGTFLYAGNASAEAARHAAIDVRVKSGKVYDASTDAVLHTGSTVKDSTVKASDTFADAAGNVYDSTTGAFLYAGSAAANAARTAGRKITVTAGNAYDATTGALISTGTAVADGTYSAADYVADGAGNLYHATTGAFISAGSAIADAARSASSSVSHFAEDAYDTAGRFGRTAQETLVDSYEASRDRLERGVQENPLAVGLGCLAAGLLVGFAIPRTRTENQWMGASRDRLVDQTTHSAYAALEQAKHSAADAMGMTLDEMERQGLTPKELVDRGAQLAKQAAGQIGSDVSHAAQAAGLNPQSLKAKAGAVAEHRRDRRPARRLGDRRQGAVRGRQGRRAGGERGEPRAADRQGRGEGRRESGLGRRPPEVAGSGEQGLTGPPPDRVSADPAAARPRRGFRCASRPERTRMAGGRRDR